MHRLQKWITITYDRITITYDRIEMHTRKSPYLCKFLDICNKQSMNLFIVSRAFLLLRATLLSNYSSSAATSLPSSDDTYQLFPRKSRTSVKRFFRGGNPQQNPLQLPSSSSCLLDLNTIPVDDSEMNNPENPCSSSSFLNLNTIATDSGVKNPQNPNVASSSSSFLGNYYRISAGSASMIEMRKSRNLNSGSSMSENKSRKRQRLAVEDNKLSKKLKVETFSWIGREIPESLTQMMKDTSEAVAKWGERSDLRLIFQKTLFKTDVNPKESRLSMPFNELIRKDFLNPVELRIIREDINNKNKTGVGAILLDERNVKWGLMLKRWEMKKDSGKGSWNYALTCGWNEIVKANGLKQGDNISIWSFRWGGLLCFALVTPPPVFMAQSSSFSLTS